MDNLTKTKSQPLENCLYRTPPRVLERVRSQPFTRDFIVTEVGHLKRCGKLFQETERRHAGYLLMYVSRGYAQLSLKRQTLRIDEKHAVLIPPKTSYSYEQSSSTNFEQYWINFDSSGAEALLAWTAFSESDPVLFCAANQNVKRHFNAILNAMQRGYTEHTALQLSLAIIKILISFHENPQDRDRTGSLSRIETSMNLMREEVSSPQSLEHYARKAGYSTTQFSKLFRQHTGTSPINYLNELRIQRAGELLKSSDRAIKDIAHELGFEDPLYFSRCFRKCVGLSPRAYRER